MNQSLTDVDANAPILDKRTVKLTRLANSVYRSREHLTEGEVMTLIEAARSGRYGTRDAAMILIAFRHALRASELVSLRWSDFDFKGATLNVRRVKHSISGVHPLEGDEIRAVKRLSGPLNVEFVFVNERHTPVSVGGFRMMVKRAALRAGLAQLRVHPHMLRHAAGYTLTNRGCDTRMLQDYMGHANISSTVRYTAVNATRYRSLWRR